MELEQEYKQALQNKETQENTKALIEEIKSKAENLVHSARKQADNNKNLVVLFDSNILTKSVKSNAVARVTINKTTNKISINMLNGFVSKVMSVIYNADFNKVYEAVSSDYPALTSFNAMVRQQITQTPEEFIKRL